MLLVPLLTMGVEAAAQTPPQYPSRTIRFVVPYPAGGATDGAARTVAERLSSSLGESVIVENKPGATGQVGIEQVARSPADGYTILVAVGSIINNELLRSDLHYKLARDFVPITLVFTTPVVLSVNSSVPVTTLNEFIQYARAHPGELSFGSTGEGSAPHIFSELLRKTAGVQLTHAPYAGEGPATADLMGGHLKTAMTSGLGAKKASQSGKTRMIAVASAKRSVIVPDVPTFTELGVPGLEKDSWVALFAPVGTPRAVVDKLSAEVSRILELPEVRDKFVGMGLVAEGGSADRLMEVIRTDTDYWSKAIKLTGMTVR